MTNRTMRAKMVVASVTQNKDSEGKVGSLQLSMAAVAKSTPYGPDGSDEDNTFARWSPSAQLQMYVVNPELFDKIRVGQKFYVDFTLAPDSPVQG